MFGFLVYAGCAIASGMIGAGKNRMAMGWLLGILIGPIGLIIILVMPAKEASAPVLASAEAAPGEWKCPRCGALNRDGLLKCQSCAADKPA